MSLFKRKKAETRSAENEISVDTVLLNALMGETTLTPQMALEIPAFSSAVDFIAQTVADLPVELFREIPGKKAEKIINDNRLFALNDEAEPLMSAIEAKKAFVSDMLIYGAGYLYIDRINVCLRYVRNDAVSVQINADPIFKDADIWVHGKRYYPWDFVILTRNSKNGVTGVGIVEEHKTLLLSVYNQMKFEKSISQSGGNKKGFLQSEHKLSEEEMERLRSRWREMYENPDNMAMVLNNGIKYNPSASSPMEMQLNQNKITNAAQVSQIFGLSPAITSGTADKAAVVGGIKTAVMPVVSAFQASLNRSLLTEKEKHCKEPLYFALNIIEILRADTLERYQAYAVGLQNNFLQIDEVRYMEDKEPLGVNYIKLGLQDVLLDPKTGRIYTPNTDKTANLMQGALTNEEHYEMRK